MTKLIIPKQLKTFKRIFFVAIIIFLSTFLQIYWAMGTFSDRMSSGCLECSFFYDTFMVSLLTSFFLTILFQILYFIKSNFVKIPIEFLFLSSVWLFWNYTIFVERESSWSTYLFNEEINYTLSLSFLPILVLTFTTLIIINYKFFIKNKVIKIKKIFLFLIVAFALQSCENKTNKAKKVESIAFDTVKNSSKKEIKHKTEENENNPNEPEIEFPKKGNNVTDFLPEIGIYEIQYETNGDLNNDGLDDIAVVLIHKEMKKAERPILILLQNTDKSFRLDKVSNFVMPIEYTESDNKIYDTENISIEKEVLKIRLYGTGGPSGNIFSDFKYFKNDLVLIYIETYNAGAGSWQKLYYDLEKGEITEEITNTMEESLPTKEKTFKIPKKLYKFEVASPDNIINEAYEKIDSEW